MKRVILRLSGGLGNQLFAYAAARALADRLASDLIVDASNYSNEWTSNAARPIELHKFPVRARFRHLGESLDKNPLFNRVLRRLFEDTIYETVSRVEPPFRYSPIVVSRPVVKLDGCFVSPRYFVGSEASLKRELDPSRLMLNSPQVSAWKRHIHESENACFVHVRRGDFLTHTKVELVLDDFELYLESAIRLIAHSRPGVRFYCFSDEPNWLEDFIVRANLEKYSYSMVSGRDLSPLEEFFLMSRCTDAIMSNSSFSWWAAFLRPLQGLTLLPTRWDKHDTTPISEMLMPGWECVDATGRRHN